jgi:hypothetical protein
MTKDQIETVLDRVYSWPKSRQEDAVRILVAMEEQDTTTYVLSDEERADLHAALDEVSRRDIALESEALAILARHLEA